MGHMNVRHYFGRANDGLCVLCLRLGLPPRQMHERGLIVRARDQHIRFSKELRPGAGFVVRAAGLEHGPQVLTTYQELRTLTDEVSATVVTQLGLLQMDATQGGGNPVTSVASVTSVTSVASVTWPEQVQRGLAELHCTLPAYAAPRGVVERAARVRPRRAEAIERGMLPGFLGVVSAADCDAHGVMRESACMGRIADGIAHFFVRLQGGARPEGVGGAALEYRFVFHAWPRLSDVIEVRSALSALSNKALQVTHYLFDLASGECFASSQAVVVWFDLQARKSVAIPAETRAQLQEQLIPDLTI